MQCLRRALSEGWDIIVDLWGLALLREQWFTSVCFHNAAISLETDLTLSFPTSKHLVLSTRSQIAETFPNLSSSLQLCFQEGHYHIFAPPGFNSPIRGDSNTSVGAGQSMALSLETNSPSDLNKDPVFIHHFSSQWNGSGIILPSFICYSALPFVGLLLLMLWEKQTLHTEVSQKYLFSSYGSRQPLHPQSSQVTTPRWSTLLPGLFFQGELCVQNTPGRQEEEWEQCYSRTWQ